VSARAWLAPLGAAWIAMAAGCFSPELTPGLPCATDHDPPCPEGQVCDLAAQQCVPDSSLDTWRDDSAADFADPSAVFDDAAVEANGAVSPTPYLVEGVAISGIDDTLIGPDNEDVAPWDDIARAPTAGRGFWRGELDVSFGGEPPGTGLDNLGGITIRIEGEIYLFGTTELQLDCDERCFFDVGDPATGAFTRVAASDQGPPDTGTAVVATEGWYPFHAAVEADGSPVQFELMYDDDGELVDIEPERLRARVDTLAGLALDGFDEAYLHGPTGTTLSAVDLGQRQDYGNSSFPDDIGDLGNGSWTARWSGQVLVTVAGAYAFTLDSRGGHRMWLDGVEVADHVDANPAQVTTTPAMILDAGWHDLVIDVLKDGTSSTPAYFQITIAQGPELVGAFFPVDRQRPVTGRVARWTTNGNSTTVAIPDIGSAAKSVFADLPNGVSTVLIADYVYSFTHPLQSTVSLVLDRPGAGPQTLIAAGALTGTGAYAARVRFDDVQGPGGWQLTGADTTADVMTGSLTAVNLSTTYTGGTAPFPTRARYTSRVRELGAVVAYSGVRWQTRQAAADQVIVSVRSCDDAACTDVPWTAVPSSGAVAGIPPRRFAQYQIEITGDGDHAPALDWIEIDYRL
jgi:hypothetical protein